MAYTAMAYSAQPLRDHRTCKCVQARVQGMCVNMWVGMCMDTYIDMLEQRPILGLCTPVCGHVYGHVHRAASRHAHRHARGVLARGVARTVESLEIRLVYTVVACIVVAHAVVANIVTAYLGWCPRRAGSFVWPIQLWPI